MLRNKSYMFVRKIFEIELHVDTCNYSVCIAASRICNKCIFKIKKMLKKSNLFTELE